jgi:hypothetical protein
MRYAWIDAHCPVQRDPAVPGACGLTHGLLPMASSCAQCADPEANATLDVHVRQIHAGSRASDGRPGSCSPCAVRVCLQAVNGFARACAGAMMQSDSQAAMDQRVARMLIKLQIPAAGPDRVK